MEIDYVIIGICISYGVSFTLLYTRKQKWNSNSLRWRITGVLFIIGFLVLLNKSNNKDFMFFSWCLITPIIYNLLDRIFKKISELKNNRDFYLWLRGSFEIDDSLFGKNPHVKGLDRLFSIILIMSIILLPLIRINYI